jgi:predicted aconitase
MESSAVAFSNSVPGGRTNIEGLHSSFASAVTGKTPLWGMHLDESRLGKVIADVEVDMELIRASFPFLAVVIAPCLS